MIHPSDPDVARPVAPEAARESRRERNKRLTREAILEAASTLFRERGYDEVTTQEIAELADVSNGTFFRYAGTKADLLLALMTERVIEGRTLGIEVARQGGSVAEAMMALLGPASKVGRYRPALILASLRELLFARPGTAGEALEDVDAMAELEEMESAIIEILRVGRGAGFPEERLRLAARVLYSTSYIDLVRFAAGREPMTGLGERMRHHVETLVDALLPLADRDADVAADL